MKTFHDVIKILHAIRVIQKRKDKRELRIIVCRYRSEHLVVFEHGAVFCPNCGEKSYVR